MRTFPFVLFASLLAPLTLFAEDAANTDAASVPEPSAAILGGICGILFLLWRKK